MKSLAALLLFLSIFWSSTGVSAAPDTQDVSDPAAVELHYQHRHGAVRDSYWMRMAWCETRRNWQDRGNFAGGLGIARQTWVGFGGHNFASTPDKATITEQLVIANRISIFGYQTRNVYITQLDHDTNKPFFRNPVGFRGWGCHTVVGVPNNRRHFR